MKWFWLYAMCVAILSFLIIKFFFPLIEFDPSGTIKIVFTSVMNAAFALSSVYLQSLVNIKNQRKSLKLLVKEISEKIADSFGSNNNLSSHEILKKNSEVKKETPFRVSVENCRKLSFDLAAQNFISEKDYKTILELYESLYSNEDLQNFISKLNDLPL